MTLTNKAYDLLKKIVQIILPGLATLYTGLAELWNLPYVTAVVGTITLLTVFLGLVLSISTRQYNKTEGSPDADLVVSEVDGQKFLSLGINRNSVEEMVAKDTVRLAVVRNSDTPSS